MSADASGSLTTRRATLKSAGLTTGMIPQLVSISSILKQNEMYGACWPLAVHLHEHQTLSVQLQAGTQGKHQALSRCAP